ncbi:MAG: DUF1282 family protein [Sterolibacterium sp.]|nr:DUF1282 family protein [Sterolibacterium sp.]
MKITALSRMPFSPKAAWPEVAKLDAHIARLFLSLVIPLSLLPPVLIYLAGHHYGDAFIQGFSSKPWGQIAIAFFFGEIASVALMGWLIRQVAATWHGKISYRSAYLLAAIAPIPLWVSSLGLLVPSILLNVLLSFSALGLSCALIYRGVQALCNIEEDIEAAAVTQVVFGAGMIVWGLLLSLVVLPV